ncbi:MAG: sigma-70 family RNA polymerase sigma factor [Bacteroidales bacterium]|jgi:RNA polymerase sigma-70 factor (ECF subfamily)|nr:sigma-70 family RNA polymerase sigma factor [Bacteroidales bacterium]
MEITNGFSEKAIADLALVEEAKKGSEKAFTSIMSHYRDSVYFMLLKMVGNVADAEDLTVEAFGKAFLNIDTYTPEYAFSTWLFKIATNNCVDFIRKKQMSPASTGSPYDDLDSITVTHLSSTPNPEESLINSQKVEILKNIVNQLKPRYRKIIQLRYYEEYSYEEIADELDIPIGSVKAELFRAKTLIQNVLVKTGNR